MRHLRVAWRALRRSPLPTLSVVLVVALGCAAATTVFALLDAALLSPLKYGEADRLVALFRVERSGMEPRNPAPPADFLDWRAADSFDAMVAARVWTPTLTGNGDPARIRAVLATPGLFELLAVAPLLGRADAASGSDVVIGYAFWQRRLGGDPSVIGRELLLDGERRTVVAVMPAGFRFPPFWATDAELWAPLALTPAQAGDRGASYLRVFARLRDGVPIERARLEMAALGSRLASAFPETNDGVSINVEPLREPTVASSRRVLMLIAVAVGLLLLLTCANVGHVLLARALDRRRETAVRVALGAGRTELVLQGLTEALLLCAVGGVLGVLLSLWALRLIVGFGPPSLMPAGPPEWDLRVAAFALLLTVATASMIGLLPALRLDGTAPAEALRSRSVSRRDAGMRNALVVLEVALASVLVAVAVSTTAALAALGQQDPGFDPDAVVAVVAMPGARYQDRDAQLGLLGGALERLRSSPGVRAAAVANHAPVAGDVWRTTVDVDGLEAGARGDLTAVWRVIGGDWFDAIGGSLVRGRSFADALRRPGDAGAVLINETFARKVFGDGDPIGRRIRLATGDGTEPWLEIVGVAADMAQSGVDVPTVPEVLLPYAANPAAWFREASFVVALDGRTDVNIAGLVRSAVHGVDPGLPVETPGRLGSVLRGRLSDRIFAAGALGGFGAVALLLAAVGLYAVLLQTIQSRTQELAIRQALGARRADVMALVVGSAFRLVGAGLGVGVPLAAATLTILERHQPGLGRWSVVVATTLVAVVVAGVAAAAGPARRASGRDPFTMLRDG